MLKRILILNMLVASAVFAENMIKNPDFSISENNKPSSWRIVDGTVQIIKGETGNALSYTVDRKTGSQGQVIQFVDKVNPEKQYIFKGKLKSTEPGLCFYQIKLYKNKKEIQRISSKSSKKKWSEVSVIIPSAGADRIGILCRTKRNNEKYIGQTGYFSDLSLREYIPTPLKITDIEATSNLHSIGIAVLVSGDFTSTSDCNVKYRKVGEDKWLETFKPSKRITEQQFRVSLLNLEADTEYEIATTVNNQTKIIKAKTWPVTPPVAQIIKLADIKNGQETLVIDKKGKPDGWIKIVPEGEGIIDINNDEASSAVLFKEAEYVIFEGFKVTGGINYGIVVQHSHDVLINNCDISQWGQKGILKGKDYVDEKTGKAFRVMGGIRVTRGANRIRMERNYIHDPKHIALSWEFGHPNGPTGISLSNNDGNNLIYNNQIIGSQEHWWNDGIEGEYNTYITGGPNHNTDIEANIIAFCNDDGMELDGGQKNVRVGFNYILWAYCGISCAPNRGGPSYLYRNIIKLGDERESANFAFKLAGKKFMPQGITYIINNTVSSHGETLKTGNFGKGATPIYSRNNIYDMGTVYFNDDALGDFDYDLYGIDSFMYEKVKPEANGIEGYASFYSRKDGDFRLKTGSLGIDAGTVTPLPGSFRGKAPDMGAFEYGDLNTFPLQTKPVSVYPRITELADTTKIKVIFKQSAGKTWKALPNIDWISCEPASGICDGKSTEITVKVDMDKINQGRHRAAITFRSETGEADAAFFTIYKPIENPIELSYTIADATHNGYLQGISTVAGEYLYVPKGTPHKTAWMEFDVNIPETDEYQIWARVLVEGPNVITHDSAFLSVDGSEPQRWNFQWRTPGLWQWVPFLERGLKKVKLDKGPHKIKILNRENNVRISSIKIINGTPAYKEPVYEQ